MARCCGKKIRTGKQIIKGYPAIESGKHIDFRVRICVDCDYRFWIGRTLWCSVAKPKDRKCPKNFWVKVETKGT